MSPISVVLRGSPSPPPGTPQSSILSAYARGALQSLLGRVWISLPWWGRLHVGTFWFIFLTVDQVWWFAIVHSHISVTQSEVFCYCMTCSFTFWVLFCWGVGCCLFCMIMIMKYLFSWFFFSWTICWFHELYLYPDPLPALLITGVLTVLLMYTSMMQLFWLKDLYFNIHWLLSKGNDRFHWFS